MWRKSRMLVVYIFSSHPSQLIMRGEGEPTHTSVPCWINATLPPRNQCTECFAPATMRPLWNWIFTKLILPNCWIIPFYMVSIAVLCSIHETLGTIGQNLNVFKSIQLHVGIFQFFFTNLRYSPWIPLKWLVICQKSWTSTGYFSNSLYSFVTTSNVFI